MRMMSWLVATICALGLAVAAVRAQSAPPVYAPGNGVSLPVLVSKVNPDYTQEAKDARIEGTVVLACVVDSDGRVSEATVSRSLDPIFGLDQQAVNALKAWRFKPGEKDGKPVAVRVVVEMAFTLK